MRDFVSITEGRSNKASFKSLKQLPARVRRGMDNAMRSEQGPLKKDTTDGMEEKKTGRDYFVHVSKTGRTLKRGRWHKASAKNETPAVLSGALKKSLGFKLKKGRGMEYGANTKYARRHEKSGRTYLKKSMINRRKYIGRTLGREIKKEISKGAK